MLTTKEYALMAKTEQSHWWFRGLRALMLEQLEAAGMEPDARVVDIGCGTGGTYRSLAARYSGLRYIGVDLSPEALEYCKTNGAGRFLQGSADALPLPAGSADVAICLDVLCYGSVDPETAVRGFADVLAPDGLLVLNVPAFDSLRGHHDAAVGMARRFRLDEVERLVRDAGLETIACRYWNSFLFLPMVAWRRLSRFFSEKSPSDLAYAPSFLDPILSGLLRFERLLSAWIAPPFGSSVFVIARKPIITASHGTHPVSHARA